MSDIDLEWLENELATCDDPVHVHDAVPGLIAQIRRQNEALAGGPAPEDWSPDAITARTAALVAALDGFELVETMPDGSRAARVAGVHFSHLVAAGGHVDRYVFGDGVGWSEVKLEMQAGDVRVALHCELIDKPLVRTTQQPLHGAQPPERALEKR